MNPPAPRGQHESQAPVDHHILIDEEEDDWAWRRKIRANPTTAKVYRIVVFVLGLIVVIGGALLIPFPGPGWLIVIGGLAIWSTEFEKAQKVLEFVKRNVRLWEAWVRRQNIVVKAFVGLAGIVFVAAVLWVTFHYSGIPGFIPDGIENWMRTTARI